MTMRFATIVAAFAFGGGQCAAEVLARCDLVGFHVNRHTVALFLEDGCGASDSDTECRMSRAGCRSKAGTHRAGGLVTDAAEKDAVRPQFGRFLFQALDDRVCFSLRRKRERILARGIEQGNLFVLAGGWVQVDLNLVGGYRRTGPSNQYMRRLASAENNNHH